VKGDDGPPFLILVADAHRVPHPAVDANDKEIVERALGDAFPANIDRVAADAVEARHEQT
jgi:hypothetical protein